MCRERRKPVSKRRGATAVLLRPPPLRRPQQTAPPLYLCLPSPCSPPPATNRRRGRIGSRSSSSPLLATVVAVAARALVSPSSRLVFFSARYSLFCSGSGRILPRSCLLYTKWLSILAPCVRTLAIVYLCSEILVDLWIKRKDHPANATRGRGKISMAFWTIGSICEPLCDIPGILFFFCISLYLWILFVFVFFWSSLMSVLKIFLPV